MFDVVFLQGMSSESIAKKRGPLFKQHIETIRAKGSVPVVVVTWAKADKMNKVTRRLADRSNLISFAYGSPMPP